MRPKSKKPRKQRAYIRSIPKNENHKLMSANLSEDLRKKKGFRSLPLRVGDTVLIVRGGMKGRSGKISRVLPQKQRIFINKVVKRKTDNTEIPVPIHPSNVVITKYVEKDRVRLELINRRIKDEAEKLDIDAIMALVDEEDEEVIEIDEDESTDDMELLEDGELDDDEIELLDEDEIDEQVIDEKEDA
ncbi:MAG: 50S ribosomal protein L24 [Candidatus Heimdallarchaeota archaeon]|nr:50S ribosomal protein L24 [Candidatus Heimdallarchaeota archaeon]MDH5646220.1 50S ribosomal protein L24 [Candidatus Heimdallarchaeota archaeon]